MDKDLVFKALAHAIRRRMLDEFSERSELTLYELTTRLVMKHDVAVSRQAIAKHVSVLEDAGLVSSSRRGKYRVLTFDNGPLNGLLDDWVEGGSDRQ